MEVVAVFKGTQAEVNLGTQGAENWRRRIAIQGLQVVSPPRWRRKAAMELMWRRRSGRLRCPESGGKPWTVGFQAGIALCSRRRKIHLTGKSRHSPRILAKQLGACVGIKNIKKNSTSRRLSRWKMLNHQSQTLRTRCSCSPWKVFLTTHPWWWSSPEATSAPRGGV